MTNTKHTTQWIKNMSTLMLTVMAILFPLSLSLLAASQRADASIFYTVNSAGDEGDANPGDGYCDTVQNNPTSVCTLRAAIQESNANPASPELIFFDIPGPGVHTIRPKTELPHLTDTVTINGYTQHGASVNTLARATNARLKIQLDGSHVTFGTTSGLHVDAPDVMIKGLVVNRFNYDIYVDDAAANTSIVGNFIGTDPSGTEGRGTTNGYGVVIGDGSGGTNNTVGGPDPAERNLISGNGAHGIVITVSESNGVYGNLIGTQRDGKSPLGNGNSGVAIAYCDYNQVGGASGAANTIAFNNEDGVSIVGSGIGFGVGNEIVFNSVFSNGGLGINLVGGTESTSGATANDKGDADTGANDLQNKPVLSSAKKSATGKTVVKGTLNSGSNKPYFLQFFSNPKGTNEGKKLLFSRYVTTDGSGNASFTFATKKKVGLGQNVTATATSLDTSEFSAPRKVVAS